MNQKVLSVSIAAYNVSDYIETTLKSLLIDKSYRKKLDIIVINDGSRDGTIDIVTEYAKKYPDCIRVIDKSNAGYGSTINISLAIADGVYFKLLDGDDWFEQDGLRGLIDDLETTDADLVISPYYKITDKRLLIAHHPDIPEESSSIIKLQMDTDLIIEMHGLTVKTEILRNFNRLITEKCFYTDFEFVFYCVMASKTICRSEHAVYCYRLGQETQSVSLAGIRKHYLDYKRVAERMFNCYCEHINEIHGTQFKILENAVKFYIYCIFKAYMLLENPLLYRKELMEFDELLYNKYPEAWKAGNRNRLVYVTRRLGFRFYGAICKYLLWKWDLEHGQ